MLHIIFTGGHGHALSPTSRARAHVLSSVSVVISAINVFYCLLSRFIHYCLHVDVNAEDVPGQQIVQTKSHSYKQQTTYFHIMCQCYVLSICVNRVCGNNFTATAFDKCINDDDDV